MTQHLAAAILHWLTAAWALLKRINPSLETWKGAVLGVAASGLFALLVNLGRRVAAQAPLRRLLVGIGSPDASVGIYVRAMSAAGQLSSTEPPAGPDTEAVTRYWQRITGLFARADVIAAVEVSAVVGESGKKIAPSFRSVEQDPGEWDEHVIAVGGNHRTFKVLRVAEPRLVEFDEAACNNFRVRNPELTFADGGPDDFGVIYRGQYPGSGVTCLAIMGIGVPATAAAGRFFRRHARVLGGYFGAGGFAVMIAAPWNGGADEGRVVWSSPRPPLCQRLMHPLAWYRWHGLVKAGETKPARASAALVSTASASAAGTSIAVPLPPPGESGSSAITGSQAEVPQQESDDTFRSGSS
jgi:hypothetical protein